MESLVDRRGLGFRRVDLALLRASCAGLLVALSTGCASENSAGPAGLAAETPSAPAAVELLNASYDATRELWQDLNGQFIADYKHKTGIDVTIKQSHGGSSSQARAVIDGLE